MNLVSVYESVANRQPDAAAVSMGARRLTYASLMDAVALTSGGLRELGVRRGDRVLLYSGNRPEYLIAHLAVARLGAITATANPSFRQAELAYILANSTPRLALVDEALRPLFTEAAGAAGAPVRTVTIDELPAGIREAENADCGEHDGVLISYTSGTSTRPKPVFHSHGGQVFVATTHARIWRMTSADQVLVALPLAWLYGLTTVSQSALAGGAEVRLHPHFNPAAVVNELAEQQATVFIGVTTMYLQMLQVVGAVDTRPANRLRLCVSGGEPRNEAAFTRFQERFGVPVHEVYATSECLPIFAYDPVIDPQPVPGSAGRLVGGVDVEIKTEAGATVAPGDVGELFARSPGQMLGYFAEPELTAEVLSGGWFRTHDLFRADPDGYYFVMGRASDVIIRGGANVSPLEVEAVLEQHPAVEECAVTGLPDPVHGQRICAFVVLRSGTDPSPEELRAFCAGRMAQYKVPGEVRFLESLPRGATGKVVRSRLADVP